MPFAVLLLATIAADELDRNTLTRLASESLSTYRDVEFGYEGWSREGADGPKKALQGTYSRNGVEQSKIVFWQETKDSEGNFGEVRWTYGFCRDEWWTLQHSNGPTNGKVTISELRGPGSANVPGSFDRAFLLPQLNNFLHAAGAKVQVVARDNGNLANVVVGLGAFEDEFIVDIARGCNPIRWRLKTDGKIVHESDGIELTQFMSNGKAIWLPKSCLYRSYAAEQAKSRKLVFMDTAQRSEWYALTNGAFRCPAGTNEQSYEPPLGKQYDVIDSVNLQGPKSRTNMAERPQQTATQREEKITKEMDRLEAEGKLGKFAARPGFDWWRIVPLLLGGVLLGAAGVVMWRRRKA